MKYRDAKKLKSGQKVIDRHDNQEYVVETIEVYGLVKFVRINCQNGKSFLNEELKDNE